MEKIESRKDLAIKLRLEILRWGIRTDYDRRTSRSVWIIEYNLLYLQDSMCKQLFMQKISLEVCALLQEVQRISRSYTPNKISFEDEEDEIKFMDLFSQNYWR